MLSLSRRSLLLLSLLLLSAPALVAQTAAPVGGQLALPHALGDHMVLQRERPIHLWGYAAPGADVSATLHTHTAHAQADRLGKWSIYLPPEQAGGPYTLSFSSGTETTTLTDVLVGDVWLASGQSNMEMPLAGFGPNTPVKDAEKEIAAANHPQIRLLLVAKKGADYPLADVSATWQVCTPETAKSFSAVAYFFGREIAARQHVPVGLIDSSWGGTPADSWLSMDALGNDPALLPAFASRARFAADMADADRARAADRREAAEAQGSGKPAPPPRFHPDPVSWQPASLWNGMIAPLAPLAVRGFLWYQGETNSSPERAPHYRALLSGLIRDWRAQFAQGELPFLYVQISSFNSPPEQWGQLRDQQRRVLDVAGTAMAVSTDVGKPDNVHPPDKQTVAARLALAARSLSYGEHVPYEGPLFRQATTETTPDGTPAVRAWFDHADGLRGDAESLQGFEVAGEDGKFVPAIATVQGSTVVVFAKGVASPRYVRWGWSNVVPASLYNAAGLPLSTFTSQPPY